MNYPPESNLLDFSNSDRLPVQIEHRFLRALAEVVEAELFPGDYKAYLEHFYQSSYHKIVNRRAEQLGEELRLLYQKNTGDSADPAIYDLLQREFAGLLDQFIILHCKSLHHLELPQAILRYANRQLEEVNLSQMIFDYLDFAQEQEKVYTNLSMIPPKVLEQAMNSYLLPGKEESIFFICDQSILGSGKEGFAMTEQALYWKAHLHPARQVFYTDLENLRRDNGDWITINDFFFNVNPSINWKLFKLLKKFAQWF